MNLVHETILKIVRQLNTKWRLVMRDLHDFMRFNRAFIDSKSCRKHERTCQASTFHAQQYVDCLDLTPFPN